MKERRRKTHRWLRYYLLLGMGGVPWCGGGGLWLWEGWSVCLIIRFKTRVSARTSVLWLTDRPFNTMYVPTYYDPIEFCCDPQISLLTRTLPFNPPLPTPHHPHHPDHSQNFRTHQSKCKELKFILSIPSGNIMALVRNG